jgi:hypothetical protein
MQVRPNPKHDYLNNLEHRMRRFATDVLTARNINLEFGQTAVRPNLRIGADIPPASIPDL